MTVRLTDLQRRVVAHDTGALLVVAGPGSGKTRVLTERIRRLLEDPGEHCRVLALTFTNKAANEMKERLYDAPDILKRAFVGTLHSFCMEVLANRGRPIGIEGLPNIFESFEDRKQLLLNAVRSEPSLFAALKEAGDPKGQQQRLSTWLARISEFKNALLPPDMIDDVQERLLYEGYDAELRASAAVDYDDLLLLTYRLFTERPKVAEFYQRQYKYICIDEAQDLNEAQYRLLLALCGSGFSNVVMVGDPKQAIYVWNGADPKYLDLFQQDFGAKKVELTENFRCSSSVVRAARRLDPTYAVEGQLPVSGAVELIQCDNEDDEAHKVVNRLQSLLANGHADVEGAITLGRCAVLARNRFVFGPVQQALKERGIEYYKKFSAANYQSESDVMEQLELAIRLLANPRDRLHLEMLAKAWGSSSSVEQRTSSEPLPLLQSLGATAKKGCAQVVLSAIEALKWSGDDFKFLNALRVIKDYASSLPERDRALILQDTTEWERSWDYYVRSEPGGFHGINAFLGQVALGTTQQPTQDGLPLLTVHSAKGMEFDVVFLIGMNDGVFPDYRARGIALEEERRSMFVAVTRSKRLLFVSYPKAKTMPWGAIRVQQPSEYISEIFGT